MAELHVRVCYADPGRQFVRDLVVAPGTTLQAAIELSGLAHELPERALENLRVGIYGKLKAPDTLLRDRDRVEIYRPLIADPKESRRRRAEKAEGAKRR